MIVSLLETVIQYPCLMVYVAQIHVDLSSRVFWGFAGIEPMTSGLIAPRSEKLSFTSSRIFHRKFKAPDNLAWLLILNMVPSFQLDLAEMNNVYTKEPLYYQ